MSHEIPLNHPRYQSLKLREKVIEGLHQNVVTEAGLFAHGRGESLDYFLGEKTPKIAYEACKAAVSYLLAAKHPVISVNGNVAALAPDALVELAKATGSALEVNLFYRTPGREEAIERVLREAGAAEVLGVNKQELVNIEEITHGRRIVSSKGIFIADVVLVPLEDGDRTQALVNMGKTVLTIDLNPLSRTAQKAHVTIVDNVVRALPLMIEAAMQLKTKPREDWIKEGTQWDNRKGLSQALQEMAAYLTQRAQE